MVNLNDYVSNLYQFYCDNTKSKNVKKSRKPLYWLMTIIHIIHLIIYGQKKFLIKHLCCICIS